MTDLRRKLLIGTAMGALVFNIAAVPASANEVHTQSETKADAFSANELKLSSNKTWVFGEDNNFNDFFDQFFRKKLRTNLDGAQEVPGPGDIDGTGEAKVKIKDSKNQLCVDIETAYIDPATAAHIHHAPKGSTGAVVVNLPIPNAEGEAEGCVDVDSQLLQKIKDNPQDYYINIHNNPYPNGAIRGQLSR